MLESDGIRIEPYDQNGIHLVQNMGGEYIYVKYIGIQTLIDDLKTVLKDQKEKQ